MSFPEAAHTEAHRRFWRLAEELGIKDEAIAAMSAARYPLQPDFLGFLGTYDLLSAIIPQHWTVVDLGCAYGFQSIFFKDHAGYVGVDDSAESFFTSAGGQFVKADLRDFEYASSKDNPAFAILNYVPCRDLGRVFERFPYHYHFYPNGPAARPLGK